jgi:hypothetical protein
MIIFALLKQKLINSKYRDGKRIDFAQRKLLTMVQ